MAETNPIQYNPKIFDPNSVFCPESKRAQAISGIVFLILAISVISGIALMITHTSLFGYTFEVPSIAMISAFVLLVSYALVQHFGAMKLKNDATKFFNEMNKHDVQKVANFFKEYSYSVVIQPPTTFFAHEFNTQINNLLNRSDLTANDVKTLENFATLCNQTLEDFLREHLKTVTSDIRDAFFKNAEPQASALVVKILDSQELWEILHTYKNAPISTRKGIFEIVAKRASNNNEAFFLFCSLVKKNADGAQLILEIVRDNPRAQALFRPLVSRLFQHAFKSTEDCQEQTFLVLLYPLLDTRALRCEALKLDYEEIETHAAYMDLWAAIVAKQFDTEHIDELVGIISPIINALKASTTYNAIKAQNYLLEIYSDNIDEQLNKTIAPLVEEIDKSIKQLSIAELLKRTDKVEKIFNIWIQDKKDSLPSLFRQFLERDPDIKKWTQFYDKLSLEHKRTWLFSEARASWLANLPKSPYETWNATFGEIKLPYDLYSLWSDINRCDREPKIQHMYHLFKLDPVIKQLIIAQEKMDNCDYQKTLDAIGIFPLINPDPD